MTASPSDIERNKAALSGWSRRQALGLLSAGVAMRALAAVAKAASPTMQVMVYADAHSANDPTVQSMAWFSEFLQQQSAGQLSLRIVPSGQLGRETDTVDLMRYGVIDLVRVHGLTISNAIPESAVFALPYLFNSAEHIERVMDGALGQQVLAAMRLRGVVGLAWFAGEPRCFYNSQRPIHTPDDIRGLKLRVPASTVLRNLVRTLKGNPVPLANSDIYVSLQTHLIDGAENDWSAYQSGRHYEVARYWSQTNHAYVPDLLLMSAAKFARLTADDQALVREGARQAMRVRRGFGLQAQADTRAALLAGGVKVNEVDRDAFRRAAQPVLKRYARQSALGKLIAAAQAMA